MATFFLWMLLIGSIVAFAGGLLLLLKGDQIRAADARAGRVGASYPTPEAQRRLARLLTGIGAAGLILGVLILIF